MEIKQGDNVSILATLWLPVKINRAENQMINSSMQYPKGDLNPHSCNSQRILSPSCLPFHHSGSLRAKNGTRTRDPNLGKVVLYQLSYFRNCECKDKMLFCFCKITARKSNGKFHLRLYRPMERNFKPCFFAVFLNFSSLAYIKAGVEFLAKSRYQRYINWPPAEP